MNKLPDILALHSNPRPRYVKYSCGLIFILLQAILGFGQMPALKFRTIDPFFLEEANPEYIFFSKSGKMWFGSSRGLSSFDGSQVTYYNKADHVALFGNTLISCMAEDKHGNFWIGTHQKGVNFFESRTGKFTKIQLLLKGDSIDRTGYIQHIFVESDSSTWIATTGLGFFIYNPLNHTTRHFNLGVSMPEGWQSRYRNTPNYFQRDPADTNKIWIGAYDGIYSCDREGEYLNKQFAISTGVKETEGLPSSFCRIQKIDVPGNDTIWFSTWGNGMGYCDMKTGNTALFPQNKNEMNSRAKNFIIESFCRKSEYEYYVAPRNYLPAIFNTHTKQYSFINDYEMNKSIPYTYYIVSDNDNNVWTCKGGGVFLHSPLHKVFLEADMSLQDIPDVRANQMRDIIWDEDKKVYYTAMDFSSGVYMLDSQMKIMKIFKMPLNPPGSANTEASLWQIIKDGSGRLWALGDIFSVLPIGATRFEPVPKWISGPAFLNKTFRAAGKDEYANLLLLGGDKVYIVYHNDLHTDSILFDNSFTAPALDIDPQLQFDKKRGLLYVSGSKAIYQYDLQKKQLKKLVYDKSQNNSLPYHTVSSFILDGNGNLWVSSSHYGIRIYEPTSLELIKEFTLENSGLPANAELKSVGSETMLVETNIGLFLYDIIKNSYLKLNRENGMINNKPWGTVIVNNILFLGMRDTIQYVPLEKLSILKRTINPYVSGIKVSGFPLKLDTLVEYLQTLNLHYKQRTISFDFSAIEFLFPERIRYTYKLDGVDETWNYTDNYKRTITYSNLAPGKYSFRVKAQFHGDDMPGIEKSITIVIAPPFWETWWFRLLAIGFIAALLGTIVNYRIRQIRRKAWGENQLRDLEMKALKAQMNPHFIYNAMNSIQALVVAKKTEEASLYISKFGRLLRQVLNNSDKTLITLENELETLQLYIELEKLRMNMVVDYGIDINDEVDINGEMVPPLVFQPFVENALWHGLSNKPGEKKLLIVINEQNGLLETIIEDNGIGRSKAAEIKKQDHRTDISRGIDITTKRLIEHNKSANVKSVEISDLYDKDHQPCGTRVTLKIKQVYQAS